MTRSKNTAYAIHLLIVFSVLQLSCGEERSHRGKHSPQKEKKHLASETPSTPTLTLPFTTETCSLGGLILNSKKDGCRTPTADECRARGEQLSDKRCIGHRISGPLLSIETCLASGLVLDSTATQCQKATKEQCTSLGRELDTATDSCVIKEQTQQFSCHYIASDVSACYDMKKNLPTFYASAQITTALDAECAQFNSKPKFNPEPCPQAFSADAIKLFACILNTTHIWIYRPEPMQTTDLEQYLKEDIKKTCGNLPYIIAER